LRTSFVVLTSQPSCTTRLQSAKPTSHRAIAQLLWPHVAVACAYGPHVRPHAPQFFGSLVSSTQSDEQHVDLPGHAPPGPQCCTHLKFWHASPFGHCVSFVHSTHCCVSGRQIGVGAWQSHPVGTH